ncbi:MAG: hypothetical protein HRT57_08675 [Crocinitomicaceae bacterium]|nr:hypothetical protein [Crocinitomicaceae bacterium]
MKIGEDYDKMEFKFMNLELLEPNALLTDSLIAVVGIILGIIVAKRNKKLTTPFFYYWKILFLVYGIGFFFGGMGHVFYGYFGVSGKYFALISGLGIPLLMEHAMISLLPKEKQKKLFLLSKLKTSVAFIGLTIVYFSVTGEEQAIRALLLVPSLNTFVGFVIVCGVLGIKFGKNINKVFYLLPITVLILIPAAILQTGKISFHPWFDRNDASHVLLIITLIMYFYVVEVYRKHLQKESIS